MLVSLLLVALFACLSTADIPDHFKVSKFTNVTDHELACDNDIYCHGRLLEAVMAFSLYNDSKTFVDKPLKQDPATVIQHFNEQFPTDDTLTKETVKRFVDEHFLPEGTELLRCNLTDYKADRHPSKLANIRDKRLYAFAVELHKRWNDLCRKVDPNVHHDPKRYSLTFIPGQFIVPGGRFREIYFWDSYWTNLGLLASGLTDTVRSVIKAFFHQIDQHGFVPNGNRVYYDKRSQPPLLAGMLYEYLQATDDRPFLANNIHFLEKELDFWYTRRSIHLPWGNDFIQLFHYRADSDVPRPESFREDVELVKDLPWDQKNRTWRNLASAAEAGWDFSSRWFADRANLSTIETTDILEVDLNAFMCWNINLMRFFYNTLAEKNETYRAKEIEYSRRYDEFRRNFQRVFYVDAHSGWFDYNTRTRQHNTEFYASNAVPLFTRCYNMLNHRKIERFYDKLLDQQVFRERGIPTSLRITDEQWDAPNAWPPLNHMIIEGMRLSESARLQEVAFTLAKRWIKLTYDEYADNRNMFEKYNVNNNNDRRGVGGEYEVQEGFGWTNGVVLDLLVKYGARLNSSDFNAYQSDINVTYSRNETYIHIFGLSIPTTLVLFLVALSILCMLTGGFMLYDR